MRRLSTFIAILILLSTAAPLMACLTSTAMTQEESACCRSMHNNCGDMAAMGCCQKQIKTDNAAQPATAALAPAVQWSIVALPAPITDVARLIPRAQFQTPDEHSPPGLRIAKTTILRI
jgi:hypothetical protein